MPLFHACVVATNAWYILDVLDINAWLRLWAEREINASINSATKTDFCVISMRCNVARNRSVQSMISYGQRTFKRLMSNVKRLTVDVVMLSVRQLILPHGM